MNTRTDDSGKTPEQQRAARAAYLLGFGPRESKPEFRSKAQRRASKAARGFFGDPSKDT